MLPVAKNTESAAWIIERLHPFAADVGSIIPEGFEAYVRVFHPAYRKIEGGGHVPLRWSEIAMANERIIHSEMQFPGITGLPAHASHSQPGLWDEEPRGGSMTYKIANRLTLILTKHTRTPNSCWFAVWEGFGGLRIPPGERIPKFSLPGRDMLLFYGSVSDVFENLSEVECRYQSANLWWPEDRAWCVATDIDFEWTYVGGSTPCIQLILSDPDLEALRTKLEDGITWESDQRNPPPSSWIPGWDA